MAGRLGHIPERRRLGHIPTNGIRPNQNLVLDLFPFAKCAFSTQRLSSNYFGFCLKVRRSSDNALQDIGFIGNTLDTASLLSFTGAGNGFVHTWYDQSQNGFNLAQTVDANQPQIVATGVVNTFNGYNVVNFDASNDFLTNASISVNTPYLYSCVVNRIAATANRFQIGFNNFACAHQQNVASTFFYAGSSGIYGSYAFNDTTSLYIKSSVFDGSLTGNAERLKAYLSSAQQTLTFTGTVGTSVSGTGMDMGRIFGAGNYFSGSFMTYLLYDIKIEQPNRFLEPFIYNV